MTDQHDAGHPTVDRAGAAGEIERYWDAYAPAYDQEPDHGLADPATRAAWLELLRAALPAPPADVVDLACGTGSLTVLAAELGHRVTGIDLSEAMLARARAKAAALPHGMPVRLVRGDVADPGVILAPGSVDAVVARHILWTLPDPEAALRRWAALVRPGGRLVLVEGRWSAAGDGDYTDPTRMPWAGGVDAVTLAEAVRTHAGDQVVVTPLDDPLLWGRAVSDERYLLTATVSRRR